MITENLSTLKIHKLSKEQYERELASGNIDENALYLTPDDEIDLTPYATIEQLNTKAESVHSHDDTYYTELEIDEKISNITEAIAEKSDADHMHTIESIDGLQEAVSAAADSKFYVVTFDMGDDNQYHGDLTFAEIREKFEAGGNMVARIDGTDYIPLLSAATHQIIFSGIYQTTSVSLTINSSDVCTLSSTSLARNQHSHNVATTSVNGFMSSADKTKLDSITPSTYETKEDAQLKYDTIVEAKADWNQNDENAIDYVKNRTHYSEDSFVVYNEQNILEWIPNVGAPITENESSHQCQCSLIRNEPIEYDELIGSVLNTFEYDRTIGSNVNNTTIITDEHIIDDRINNKIVIKLNYEYVLIAYDSITYNNVTLSKGVWLITHAIKFIDETWTRGCKVASLSIPTKVYHTLSEEFIPDTIARTSYVDENFALKSEIGNVDLSNYYNKTEIDNMEFITIADIDAICGANIQYASAEGVKF